MGSRGLLRARGGSPLPLRGRSEEGAEGVRHPSHKTPSFFSSVVIATYTLLLIDRGYLGGTK